MFRFPTFYSLLWAGISELICFFIGKTEQYFLSITKLYLRKNSPLNFDLIKDCVNRSFEELGPGDQIYDDVNNKGYQAIT